MPAEPSRQAPWAVFVVGAVLSLLVSPLTAIYAAVIGVVGFTISLAVRRAITGPAAAFAGIAVGSLPYIITGLVL